MKWCEWFSHVFHMWILARDAPQSFILVNILLPTLLSCLTEKPFVVGLCEQHSIVHVAAALYLEPPFICVVLIFERGGSSWNKIARAPGRWYENCFKATVDTARRAQSHVCFFWHAVALVRPGHNLHDCRLAMKVGEKEGRGGQKSEVDWRCYLMNEFNMMV